MKSHEVIREATEEMGVKAVAAAMKLSPALVYKWCEPAGDASDPAEASGAKNPLDRVHDLYRLTKDIRLVRWLCNQADGFFVADPILDEGKKLDEVIFVETRGMLREFSELLETVTESVETDNSIDATEAVDIRERWEDLKACVERFVVGCEYGHYRAK